MHLSTLFPRKEEEKNYKFMFLNKYVKLCSQYCNIKTNEDG